MARAAGRPEATVPSDLPASVRCTMAERGYAAAVVEVQGRQGVVVLGHRRWRWREVAEAWRKLGGCAGAL